MQGRDEIVIDMKYFGFLAAYIGSFGNRLPENHQHYQRSHWDECSKTR
jgi:hypothetical protein